MALPSSLEEEIRRTLPIGSSHASVSTFIRRHGLDVAAFDYPWGDPRKGALIISLMRPRFAQPIHAVFHFDKGGPDGKLIDYEVSREPVFIPSP